ncbi:MAG: DUF2080 family transposase-associated protein [Nanoarchaeota archaeon]|nr:DUF2080 family transposase-associated protein [Nanoarchaeota archaeon]
MRKIQINTNKLILEDSSISDIFEKEVTPHGNGGKIPCSSKYIGKKAYVIIRNNEKEKKKKSKSNQKD